MLQIFSKTILRLLYEIETQIVIKIKYDYNELILNIICINMAPCRRLYCF